MQSPLLLKSESYNPALCSQEYRGDVDSQMSRENPEKAGVLSAIKLSNSKLVERESLFQTERQSDLDKVEVNLKPSLWQKNPNGTSPFQYKAFGMMKQPELNSQDKHQDFLAGSLLNQKLRQS